MKRPIAVLCLLSAFLAGCARGPEVPPPSPGVWPEAEELSFLDEIDQAMAASLGDLVSPREEWPLREAVRPVPEGVRLLTRAVPLSSLAYFPRLGPILTDQLEQAGYRDFQVTKYPVPGGETWEVEVEVDETLTYRVRLTAEVDGLVAIIIDDCGNSLRNREHLFGIDYPLTLAVLPRLRSTAAVDRLAAEHGFEVILHCPMEGINSGLDPGPGKLTRGLAADQLAREFAENIRGLPHAVGVNNHMGSAFTTDPDSMAVLMEELKGRGLFFIDSLTAPGTATGSAAAAAGVRYLSRDVFLDHEKSEEFILGQLEQLKQKALRRGLAIAIGHDRPLTLEILARELPSLAEDNLRLVPVSDLLDAQGTD
ncbi:MAG: divergent polysaccharide deacetylase family protein [Candidatus Erginobacter occultus]|nr:divergent polysaccharide deacetylase family protein [Candidatus Erginobacter occultus]